MLIFSLHDSMVCKSFGGFFILHRFLYFLYCICFPYISYTIPISFIILSYILYPLYITLLYNSAWLYSFFRFKFKFKFQF